MRIRTAGCLSAIVLVLPLAAGCGDDGGDDSSPPTTEAVADTAVADTAVADTAVADTAVADTAVADTAVADTGGDGDGDGGSLGGGEVTALTDEEICASLSGDDVGDALGIEVTEVAVGGSSTAQCAYNYASDTGGTSNISVASFAQDVELGGRRGDEAFDYVADVNRGIAGGTDFEEIDVDAGDRAIRFSDEVLHLGVLAVDGHLFTLLVPANDADGDAVDELLAVMADRFGG